MVVMASVVVVVVKVLLALLVSTHVLNSYAISVSNISATGTSLRN